MNRMELKKKIKEIKISEIISKYIKIWGKRDGIYQAECPFCDSKGKEPSSSMTIMGFFIALTMDQREMGLLLCKD